MQSQLKLTASEIITKTLKALIRFYQKYISAALPARCRYYPTCSQYALQALNWHGALKGSVLTIKRICRCHPFAGHGLDFVPLPLYRFNFYFVALPKKNLVSANKSIEQQYYLNYVYLSHFDYRYHLNRWLKKPLSF